VEVIRDDDLLPRLVCGPQAGEGDVMATLPAYPSLDQLRHQAKDLLRAAKSGDAAAAEQIAAAAGRQTLAAAQLVVARSYGFSSWPRLKAEVAARTASLDQLAAEFCVASIRDWTGKAVRMLAQTPQIAGHSFATALLLGDEARVRDEIERDPAAATRADPLTGWTPLHAVCASRWHDLDPARAPGLAATARLLLDAGADAVSPMGPRGRTPLGCATATASGTVGNEAIIALLLERGAVPDDEDLYMAAFSHDDHRCLRRLLSDAPAAAAVAEKALAAPVSGKDVTGVRLLLEAGADPRRYADDDGQPCSAVYAAVLAGCPAELIALLISHGADPGRPGPDGRTPAWLATVRGRTDLTGLLAGAGAGAGAGAAASGVTDTALLVGACMSGDRATAVRLTTEDPGLAGRLDPAELASLVHAAEAGNEPAVVLMLDLGFPVGARRDDDGATALHAAAYAGSAPVVRLLLDRGADLEALDAQWESPALDWAVVGSGYRPAQCPDPDWVATVRLLIEAGASADCLDLSPDNSKPPAADVAELLREYGIG
jgi:ankyrin repeat protein